MLSSNNERGGHWAKHRQSTLSICRRLFNQVRVSRPVRQTAVRRRRASPERIPSPESSEHSQSSSLHVHRVNPSLFLSHQQHLQDSSAQAAHMAAQHPVKQIPIASQHPYTQLLDLLGLERDLPP